MDARLILFDVDGTLVDTGGAGRTALHRAFAETFGAEAVGDIAGRTAGVRFNGMTDPAIVGAIATALGCSNRLADHLTALERRYLDALHEVMATPQEGRRVIPGMRPLLAALAERPGVTLGLVTGNIERGARIKLEPFGLNPFFAAGGFGSDHAERRHVARIAVERSAHHAGQTFAPAQVTVVGDTEHDVDCATANGYRAVAVSTGWVPRKTLEAAHPDAILDTIDTSETTLTALGL